MSSYRFERTARAIVATRHTHVRDYVAALLDQRGFTVEHAHRAEYLLSIARDADLLIADLEMLREAEFPRAVEQPHEIVVLGAPADAEEARNRGAMACFQIPFTDPPCLASTLDSVAARARQRSVAEAGLAVLAAG